MICGLGVFGLWTGILATGFAAEHVLTTQIPLSRHQYTEPAQRALLANVLERVSTLPGVLSAALADSLPPESYGVSIMFNVEGRPQHHFNEPGYEVVERSVTQGYFAVLGIPLHRGRGFHDQDTERAPHVALVNEALARRFFPNENPIGKRVGGGEEGNWKTIVGVVGDVKNQGLALPPRAEMYMPVQQPEMTVASTLIVRSVGDPKALIAAVRDQVRALDKNIPLTFTTMSEELGSQVSSQRFNSILLSAFAALALLLAAIGIYGVMSYLVTQRTQEIGIRMALGARRAHVLKLVVGHAVRLTLAGVTVGLGLALALTRYLATLLYGVTTRDAWTFCSVAFLLIGVALLASYLPALRATRVDPATALRCE
jgi:predicted permease